MPDQTDTAAAPDPRDIRIQDLEAQVKSLQAEVNELNEHADQISDGYESRVEKLQAALDRAKASGGQPSDGVYIGGERHEVLGTFRADNTFVAVKQGFCPEGVTLVAIDRAH